MAIDDTFVAIQAIGFIALLLSAASYQFKSQRQMFGMKIAADIVWVAHYMLLNAYTAAIAIFIAVLRNGLTVFFIPQHKLLVVVCATLLTFVLCLWQMNGVWLNMLPAFTALLYGCSTYFHQSYTISRLFMAAGLIVWVVIGAYVQSYPEMISSGLSLGSLALGFWRHKNH